MEGEKQTPPGRRPGGGLIPLDLSLSGLDGMGEDL